MGGRCGRGPGDSSFLPRNTLRLLQSGTDVMSPHLSLSLCVFPFLWKDELLQVLQGQVLIGLGMAPVRFNIHNIQALDDPTRRTLTLP